MYSALRVICLGLLASFAISVWHWSSIAIDGEADQRYRHQMRGLQVADTALSNDLLECRAGLVTHYDNLVHRISELRARRVGLAKAPKFLSAEGQNDLLRAAADYDQVLTDQEDVIESFKFEHAVLRNSLRFFPGESLALAEAVGATEGGDALAVSLRNFNSNVLLYYLFSERSLVSGLRDQMLALRSVDAPSLAISERRAIDLLTRHADEIIERKPKVDGAIAKMLALPSSARIRDLREAYGKHYSEASNAASGARLLVWLLALAFVLAVAALIIVRMRRSARALALASSDLESALASLGLEKEKHKELAELKSRFVSMTSHEFRTPLSVVLSSAELLEVYGASWPETKIRTHLVRVQDAAKYMKQMLDDVLLIGRAEAGKLESQPKAIDISEFCVGLLEVHQLQSEEAHEVECNLSQDLGESVIDVQLLTHILDNLVSNALKYSEPKQPISFDARRDGEEVVFTIKDRGIGISMDDQKRLFETFHRGENVGEVAGTGLGLAVVKKSIDVLQGSIVVKSKLGEGSSFVVRVPAPILRREKLRDTA